MKYILYFLQMILLLGCFTSKKQVVKIIIRYVDFEITTFFKIECASFDDYFRNEQNKIEVTDSMNISNIMGIVKTLSEDEDKYSPDTRLKLEIIYDNNSIETICMSQIRINYNGKAVKFSEKLKEQILNIISRVNH